MSSLTKMSITLDEYNSMMVNKMEGKLIKKNKDSLTDLTIIKAEIEKLENCERLDIEK